MKMLIPIFAQERFVPEEFRNWDVNIKGFDCLTSSTVKDHQLFLQVTRALPTVGCEADAIVPDIEEAQISCIDVLTDTHNGGFSDGSFSIGPTTYSGSFDQKWSVGLADGSNLESRRRARINFGRVDEGIGKVTVWLEKRENNFSGGSILPGCGGQNSSFADNSRTTIEDLAGTWDLTQTIFSKSNGWVPHCSTERLRRDTSQIDPFFSLPCGLSIYVKRADQHTIIEASWLSSPLRRTVVRRLYDESGAFEAVQHVVEEKKE